MLITEQNLQRLRDAISEYRALADRHAGKRVSWQALMIRVSASTLLYNEETDDHDDMRIANDAEALRQFVLGSFKRGRTVFREVRPALLHAVAKFLQDKRLGDFDSDPDALSGRDLFLISQIAEAFEVDYSPEQFEVLSEITELAGVGTLSPRFVANAYRHLRFDGEMPLSHVRIELQNGPRDYLTRVIVMQTCPNFPVAGHPANVIFGKMSTRDVFKQRSSGFILRISDKVATMFLRDSTNSRMRQVELRIIKQSDDVLHRLYIMSNDLGDEEAVNVRCKSEIPKPLDVFDFGEMTDAVRDAREKRTQDEIVHYLRPTDHHYVDEKLDIELQKLLIASRSIVEPTPYGSMLRTLYNYYRNKFGMHDISDTLVDLFNSGAVTDLAAHLGLGARLDVPHPKTGMTALHYIARLGWRQGLVTALEYKDRCNFTIRDYNLHLASHYASVYANDEVMARLLRIYQLKAGATLPFDPR